MAEDPGAIREAIEETRADMADTIEALGQKADVKGRATTKVAETTEQVKTRVSELGHRVEVALPDQARPVVDQAKSAGSMVSQAARRRPALAAVGLSVVVVMLLRRHGRPSAAA